MKLRIRERVFYSSGGDRTLAEAMAYFEKEEGPDDLRIHRTGDPKNQWAVTAVWYGEEWHRGVEINGVGSSIWAAFKSLVLKSLEKEDVPMESAMTDPNPVLPGF